MEITVLESPPTGDNQPPPFAFQLAGEIKKRRNAAGLSQPALAALIGYTRQYVSLAERPRRGVASAELVKAIDSVLGAGGVLVSLRQQAVAEREESRSGAPARDTAAATAHRPSQPPSAAEVQDPNHSELVAVAAAITFGARLERPVETIIATADEPQVPNRVRVGDVRHLRNTVEKLEKLDHHAGGGAVRHHGIAALRWATAMLNSSCTPEVRCELAATTAHLADLAGWATFDSGHHSAARQLFLLGLHAARESGDLGVRAHVASGLARLEIHTGNWAAGLELTQLAFTATEVLTPNAIAMLNTVKALAYACKLDAAQCRQCLGTAIDTYKPDSITNDPPWIRYFTPAKLEGDLANAMYDLSIGGADVGNPVAHRLSLVERLSSAFQKYKPDRARSKAIAATRLAILLYLEGEHRTAHQMADEAINLAGQIRSARLADDLRVLLRTSPPGHGDYDQTSDLRHRLSTVLIEMT